MVRPGALQGVRDLLGVGGAPPQAPKLSEIKLINYDFAKYGSSAERKRLLAKWDAEVGNQPK